MKFSVAAVGIVVAPILPIMRPGPDVASDEALADYIRQNNFSLYHPVGTCRMGHDAQAVVDSQLRVHGLLSLRVADASIMPTMPASNINAVAIMVGEKAADMIRQAARSDR